MQTYLFTYSLSLLLINLFTTFYFQPYLLTYLIYLQARAEQIKS